MKVDCSIFGLDVMLIQDVDGIHVDMNHLKKGEVK